MSLMPVTHVALYVYRPALIELRTDESLMLFGLTQDGDKLIADDGVLHKPVAGVVTLQLEPGVYGFKASSQVLVPTIPGVSVITKVGNGATASLAAIRAAGDDGGKEPWPTPPPPPPTRALAALASDVWASHTTTFMVAAG